MKAHLTKRLVCLILAIVLCLSAAVIPALAANDTKNVKVKVQKVSNDTVPTELNPERQAAAGRYRPDTVGGGTGSCVHRCKRWIRSG